MSVYSEMLICFLVLNRCRGVLQLSQSKACLFSRISFFQKSEFLGDALLRAAQAQ